jgi:hypothetical protein
LDLRVLAANNGSNRGGIQPLKRGQMPGLLEKTATLAE